MQVLVQSVAQLCLLLLLLLACGSTSGLNECDLPVKVQRHEVHQMSGVRWVLVEAFADYPSGREILRNASSALVEMRRNSDNETFLITETVKTPEKCITFRFNMSIPHPEVSNHSLHVVSAGVKEVDDEVFSYDDQGRAHMHQPCPHCLLIHYNLAFEGKLGNTLLVYRREGKHQDVDELKSASTEHRRIAECLKFSADPDFRYDGKAEFCENKKTEETGV